MSDELELTKDIKDDDSIFSLEEDDEETKESIRAYIG